MVPLFGAAYAAPNKGIIILYWFRPPKTVWILLQMVKFKDFSRPPLSDFSITFQGRFNFQRLFKKSLYIQVLFKHVRTMK